MNLPNKLTTLRVLLIPLFLLCLLGPVGGSAKYLVALAVFAIASFTDFLDGSIARKHGLVTDFGKLMDPLADKLLVASAMISFVELGVTPAIVVIIIISREFLVTAMRTLAAQKNIVIAADVFGKAKTIVQIVWILSQILILHLQAVQSTFAAYLYWPNFILMLLATALTVFSGINYVVKNIYLFKDM